MAAIHCFTRLCATCRLLPCNTCRLRRCRGGVTGGALGWVKCDASDDAAGSSTNTTNGADACPPFAPAPPPHPAAGAAQYMRMSFQAPEGITEATAYISAVGWAQLYINGACDPLAQRSQRQRPTQPTLRPGREPPWFAVGCGAAVLLRSCGIVGPHVDV